MQVVYFVISFIEIILTAFAVYFLIKADKAILNFNRVLDENFDFVYKKFQKIGETLHFFAKMFDVYENYKDTVKEFKNLLKAFKSVKRIINIYNLITGIKTVKNLGFIFFLKKILFK